LCNGKRSVMDATPVLVEAGVDVLLLEACNRVGARAPMMSMKVGQVAVASLRVRGLSSSRIWPSVSRQSGCWRGPWKPRAMELDFARAHKAVKNCRFTKRLSTLPRRGQRAISRASSGGAAIGVSYFLRRLSGGQYSLASMMVRTLTVCFGSAGFSLPCSMSGA
jgi:hypothetical protein